MNLQEIIDSVDKSSSDEYQELENLAKEFDIYEYIGDYDLRVKSYFYETWYCTDTLVGGRIYFFDDNPICVSYQSSRKADEKFTWISKKLFNITYKYLLSLVEVENRLNPTIITDDELTNESIYGIGYHIEYATQFTQKIDKVILKETLMPVTIVNTFTKNITGRKLLISHPDGSTEIVTTKDIIVPYLVEQWK